MDITSKCIELIESNRISSTEVADALGKKGVLPNFITVNAGNYLVGKIHYIYTHDESNWPVHDKVRDIPENCLLFVDSFNCENKAIFGDLVAKYIILYKRAKGIVVNGLMRDIPDLRKYAYRIWCKGFTPLGCYNIDVTPSEQIMEQAKKNHRLFHDGILVCDDSGCTLIEKDEINDELFTKLEMIELQEDIWSYCINTLKWSTYDTVCLKKYLSNPEFLPEVLREKVKQIPFKK